MLRLPVVSRSLFPAAIARGGGGAAAATNNGKKSLHHLLIDRDITAFVVVCVQETEPMSLPVSLMD